MIAATIAVTTQVWPFVRLAILVSIAVMVPFFLGPIAVRRSQKTSTKAKYTPLDLDADAPPPDLVQYLDDATEAFRPHGFEKLATLKGGVARARTIVALFVNRERRELAVAAGVFVTVDGVLKRSVTTIQVVTRFGEPRSVTTGNSRTPRVFGRVPTRVSVRLPGVEDVSRLLRVHRALAEREGGAAAAVLPDVGDPAAFLSAQQKREFEEQVATGYYTHDEAEDVYRPTWKGACLMTWKLLPPWKQIAEGRVRREAERLLAEHAP
jgi:hypothetical protein